MSDLYAEFSNQQQRYLRVNLKPANCDIDLATIQVFVESKAHKIQINPCVVNCEPGQFGQTASFSATKVFGQSVADLVGDQKTNL